jgi:putative MATE family efflux protein
MLRDTVKTIPTHSWSILPNDDSVKSDVEMGRDLLLHKDGGRPEAADRGSLNDNNEGWMVAENKDVKVLLGDPKKAILSMVVPTIVALLIGQINLFVDTTWCSSLGVNALSGINLVSSFYYLMLGVGNGIGIGLNVAISRLIGAGDRESASKRLSQIFVLMIAIAIPLTPLMLLIMDPAIILIGGEEIEEECRQYLIPVFGLSSFLILGNVLAGAMRGEGAAKRSSLIFTLSAIINMTLDPILIFGLGMGVMGASLATMISAIFVLSAMLRYYLSGRSYVPLVLKDSKPTKESIVDVMAVGVPQMIELNIMSLLNLVLVSLVIGTGGPEGLAMYSAPWRLVMLIMVPAQALASSMVPVCSAAVGQNDPEKLKRGYYFTVKAATIVGITLSILVAIAAPILITAFTYDPSMVQYADGMARVARIYTTFMTFYGLISVGSSMLSSLKKSQYSMLSALIRNIVLIVIYYIASFHTMDWFYWGLAVGEVFGGVLMMSLAQWFFKKKYSAMVSSSAATAA